MKKYVLLIAATMALLPGKGMADSWDAENYKPFDTNVLLEKTNLPIVFIDSRNEEGATTAIHKDYRVAVHMTIINNTNGLNYADTLAHPGQTKDYDGWVAIKYRGNSSFDDSDKKPYGFKTLKTADVDGEKKKVELLGMPKDNNWVMLAPYHDRSLIRDVLMYQLARPYFEFTPNAKFCEMFLDGTYYGVYILCEKPSKGKHRLNLTEPGDSGDELTGDYLVQIDRNNEPHYVLKHKMFNKEIYMKYDFPEYEDMIPAHPAQVEYIQRCMDAMEDALSASSFASEEVGYRKYIDVRSFVDYQLSTEFASNPDGYRLSTNIYKRRDSVDPHFKAVLWDFNLAFGNNNGDLLTRNAWMYQVGKGLALLGKSVVPFWWDRLTEDEAYWRSMKERWAEYRMNSFASQHINDLIDSLVNELNAEGACERNYQTWPNWEKKVNLAPNHAKDYPEEIAFLRQWIERRVAWMDSRLNFDASKQAAGIAAIIPAENLEVEGIYSLKGQRVDHPHNGIFVVRYKDGSTRKKRFFSHKK